MKKFIFLFFFFLIVSFLFFKQNNSLTYSFYHWKNSYSLENVKEKLYIKVLDIDYSDKLEIIKTSFEKQPRDGSIPTVYITNKTIKVASLNTILNSIIKNLDALEFNYDEVQIDCDWSLNTKYNYFKLLEELKTKLNKKLSVTIRLHQIKYFAKTGVPKVDYGVLMYYNMSNIQDFQVKNSIIDNTIAKKYHYNFDKYPLKLKLALPLYSQAVQFRNQRALDFFEGVKIEDFSNNFKKLDKNIFQATKSFYFRGKYIYKNDIFRFEDSSFEELEVALKDFYNLSKNSFSEVIFYTIDYKNKYDLNKLIKGF
ncbi:hypothetical protein CRU99_04600 [Malaciobacter mytili]|nr:hypothetical protein CRU99_04600 [Malaciobacter mytili]